MNQIPASILILTASILAYASTTGTNAFSPADATQPTAIPFILGLASMLLGIWGVISLIQSCIRDRELMFDNLQPRHDVLGMFDPRRMNMGRPYAPMGTPTQSRPADPAGISLTPEMKAQLSMAAHLEGRDRSAIIEEALRRYLPRYENSKAA